jgi:hypothetical protein
MVIPFLSEDERAAFMYSRHCFELCKCTVRALSDASRLADGLSQSGFWQAKGRQEGEDDDILLRVDS